MSKKHTEWTLAIGLHLVSAGKARDFAQRRSHIQAPVYDDVFLVCGAVGDDAPSGIGFGSTALPRHRYVSVCRHLTSSPSRLLKPVHLALLTLHELLSRVCMQALAGICRRCCSDDHSTVGAKTSLLLDLSAVCRRPSTLNLRPCLLPSALPALCDCALGSRSVLSEGCVCPRASAVMCDRRSACAVATSRERRAELSRVPCGCARASICGHRLRARGERAQGCAHR